MSAYRRLLRSFHRDVRLFLFAAALQGFSISGVRKVLFNLYLLRLGYGPEFVGLANAVGWLAVAGFSVVAGAIGARWGNRRALLAGMVLMSGGTGLLPLAESVSIAWQVIWVLACTVLAYLGVALYFVNSLTFLMGVTGPRERGQAYATQVALETLAGFAGSLIGGALPAVFAAVLKVSTQDPAPYRYPQFLAAVLLIPGVLGLSKACDHHTTPLQERMTATGQAPYGLILVLTIAVMLRLAGRSAVDVFFNIYLDTQLGASTSVIGALSAAALLLSAPVALAATPLVARWGKIRTITVASLAMALSILPLALFPHLIAAGAGFIGLSVCFVVMAGPMRMYTQEIVAPVWRGAMSGVLMTGVGLTNAAMALGGGYAIATAGFRGMFLLGAALTVVGALLFWAYFRVPRGEAKKDAPAKVAPDHV